MFRNKHRNCFATAILLLGVAGSSHAASTVQQSGAITPGHAVQWIGNGVIGDAGSSSSGALTSIGVTASGAGICQNSGPVTGPFNRLCMSVTATGGALTFDNIGEATGGFSVIINGAAQGFGTVALPVTTDDFTCIANSSGNLKDCGFANVSVARGGTGAATAQAARAAAGLNIDACTATGDANFPIVATTRCVYHTALSASRTDTLPPAASVNAGQVLYVTDFSGAVTSSRTISLAASGSDMLVGPNGTGATLVALATTYGTSVWISDGASKWTYAGQNLAFSGDCTVSIAGVIVCTKTNGSVFGYFATGSDAGQLSGNLAIGRFNAGAGASGSTFWRGDGVWAIPNISSQAYFNTPLSTPGEAL